MLRARFVVSGGDARPAIWPIPHPYWCTGFNSDDFPYVVAYVDDEHQLLAQWPDAIEVTSEPAQAYVFTDRFAKPTWFAAQQAALALLEPNPGDQAVS